jgi:hypothetical protein
MLEDNPRYTSRLKWPTRPPNTDNPSNFSFLRNVVPPVTFASSVRLRSLDNISSEGSYKCLIQLALNA